MKGVILHKPSEPPWQAEYPLWGWSPRGKVDEVSVCVLRIEFRRQAALPRGGCVYGSQTRRPWPETHLRRRQGRIDGGGGGRGIRGRGRSGRGHPSGVGRHG